ncbi:hypothetical protein NUW54_g11697 [Trametes sanguinea]|uniref:Uncharacterized protein n=1 Tax=Trametes sanguinea TaxID=158606 RepID=A0ACC1N9W4_9APHY|nr:hypothetical protein NUW54_g11697 [Trametes sanguinea]
MVGDYMAWLSEEQLQEIEDLESRSAAQPARVREDAWMDQAERAMEVWAEVLRVAVDRASGVTREEQVRLADPYADWAGPAPPGFDYTICPGHATGVALVVQTWSAVAEDVGAAQVEAWFFLPLSAIPPGTRGRSDSTWQVRGWSKWALDENALRGRAGCEESRGGVRPSTRDARESSERLIRETRASAAFAISPFILHWPVSRPFPLPAITVLLTTVFVVNNSVQSLLSAHQLLLPPLQVVFVTTAFRPLLPPSALLLRTKAQAPRQLLSRPPPSAMNSRPHKQSMSELKLRRLTEHNQRLREDLARPRIRVSEASASLIRYCKTTKDPLVRTLPLLALRWPLRRVRRVRAVHEWVAHRLDPWCYNMRAYLAAHSGTVPSIILPRTGSFGPEQLSLRMNRRSSSQMALFVSLAC